MSRGSVTEIDGLRTTPIDRRHQQDAVRVEFAGQNPAQVYLSVPDGVPVDLKRYLNAGGSSSLRSVSIRPPETDTHRDALCLAVHPVRVDLAGYIPAIVDGSGWVTVRSIGLLKI